MNEQQKLKRATYHLWTFFTSKIISSFGAQVYAFAVSYYILQLTGSATNFAMNLICSILPRALVAPFAGYVADNFSRKKIVIIAQIAQTASIAGLLVFSLNYGLSLTAIYITTVLLSLASTFTTVTFTSSITGLVDESRIQKAMSLNQMSISFAAIGSPAIAGILYGTISMQSFLIIYMIASIVAVILESTMNFNLFAKRKEKSENVQKESMWKSMKEGLAYLKLQEILMTIIWISLFINFLFGAFQVGYSYILINLFEMEPEHFGLTEAAWAIGMLIFSFYFSMRKEVKYPLLVSKYGIISMAVVMGAVALPLLMDLPYYGMFAFYVGIMFCFGCLGMIVNTPIGVMMQKTIDDDYKGRVFSVIETMALALMPLGTVLFGFLYDLVPAQWVLMLSSLVLIVVVLVMARPSIVRKTHPELYKNKLTKQAESSVEM